MAPVRCDSPNWGENADWCVLHQQEPLLCVSLARESLEQENRELRSAARIGAKNLRLFIKEGLQEGCGCEPEGHVCGIKDVQADLEFIENTVKKTPLPVSPDRVTVREACRRRFPLGGADAQALEHGLTQLEQEKAAIQKQYDDLVFKVQMMKLEHPDGCAQAGLMIKREMDAAQVRIHAPFVLAEKMIAEIDAELAAGCMGHNWDETGALHAKKAVLEKFLKHLSETPEKSPERSTEKGDAR